VTCAREYAAGGRRVLWTWREFSIRIFKGLIVWMLKFITTLVMCSGWILNSWRIPISEVRESRPEVGIRWKLGWIADMIWGLAKGIPSSQQISVRHSVFF
jgi:hypothetical protein